MRERRTNMLAEEGENAKKIGQPITPEVLEAVTLKAAIDTYTEALHEQQSERKDTQVPRGDRFKLTAKQKTAAALAALRDNNPGWFNYTEAKTYLDSLRTPDEIETYLGVVRREAYNNVLSIWHEAANAAS